MDKDFTDTDSFEKYANKAYCFECGQFISEEFWLKTPSDTYGCSRHV